jgi:integrase
MPRKSTHPLSIPTVAVSDLGPDRYRLRWREGARSREVVFVGNAADARMYIARLAREVAEHGTFTVEARREAAGAPPAPPATVDALLTGFVAARRASGRFGARTEDLYGSYSRRFVRATGNAPVSALSRALFERVMAADRDEGVSAVTAYAPLRLVIDAWRWGSDGNAEDVAAGRAVSWPGLPPAPRSPRDYLPRAPRHGRTVAPTLAEADACLRHLHQLASDHTRALGVLMRYTGLRASQVMGIHREDLDLPNAELAVRVAKTDEERADARTIPLSAALLAEPVFRAWVDFAPPSGPMMPPKAGYANPEQRRKRHAIATFTRAWEAATAAGEAKRASWSPPNRAAARPEHAFRAAFQAHLTDARVDADVVDFLVGHASGGVREKHYGRELLAKARAAVDALPPIDWRGPGVNLEAGNVVPLRRG